MHTLAGLIVLFLTTAIAQAQPALTCDFATITASSDVDLDARDCALQKLFHEAKSSDERDRCISALREVVLEQFRRQAARRHPARCIEAVAQADQMATCADNVRLATYTDDDLDARYCVLQPQLREEDRRRVQARPENEAQSSACLAAVAAIARERLRRNAVKPLRPTCPN